MTEIRRGGQTVSFGVADSSSIQGPNFTLWGAVALIAVAGIAYAAGRHSSKRKRR